MITVRDFITKYKPKDINNNNTIYIVASGEEDLILGWLYKTKYPLYLESAFLAMKCGAFTIENNRVLGVTKEYIIECLLNEGNNDEDICFLVRG